MTADVIEHAFEPFFTTKREGAGTGLGLATVYGIITQAEGHIQVYSEPGAGTTFTHHAACHRGGSRSGSPEPVPYQRTPKGETVLVVEDEEALREVTKRIFTRNGYRVITAGSGPEALDIARGHPGEIHLLVTDVVMPHMLGKEVAEKMRAIKPGIEVLFMSGYARPVLASQGRLDPNVALVEKPFSEAELLAKAGQVLNGHFQGSRPPEATPADAGLPPAYSNGGTSVHGQSPCVALAPGHTAQAAPPVPCVRRVDPGSPLPLAGLDLRPGLQRRSEFVQP